ncbi:MAG TPA: hypothetical protein EYP52_09235 [Anaerolineae bacterium]|nr:hypothetical protein [Anaerolineae bacterium]
MSDMKVSPLQLRLLKPTLDTPFHISHEWWEREGRDFRIELRAHLCPEHREIYKDHFDTEVIDWVDERTGEVIPVDGLQHLIQEHCSQQPGYLGRDVSLVDAVFRVFLANGNRPLTCRELADITGRPADRILRTLSGKRVYKGLRPVLTGR